MLRAILRFLNPDGDTNASQARKIRILIKCDKFTFNNSLSNLNSGFIHRNSSSVQF